VILLLLFLSACFLAYSNGANDNFKGVASLYGSGACGYRTALGWATITTLAGSLSSIFLAQALLKKFSGKGLVPDALTSSEPFLLAVVLGAAVTVILATLFGFPVSTTHGLTGALVGCGWVAVGSQVNFEALRKSFLLPLLLSPVLAIALGAMLYLLLRLLRIRCGLTKEWCFCLGSEQRLLAMPQPGAAWARQTLSPEYSAMIGRSSACSERYAGSFVGVSAQRLMDALHFLSAGTVCFARSLNDTPKIVAMLLIVKVLDLRWGFLAVVGAMVAGGLIHSRKIAETMGRKITKMNHGQGFSANVATGILVILASVQGLPVSTTHVAVGSLFGVGLTTGQANPKVMTGIVLSWVLTLPCAAFIGACAYRLLTVWLPHV
jgi:PiT family inorganic phosphate transporter